MTFNLPIGLMAFRVWMLLAIPVSIICGLGLAYVFKKISPKYAAYTIIIILIAGLFWTSFIPKWQVNTSPWGTWFGQASDEEVQGYILLPEILPKDSRVFSISGFQGPILAYDMEACEWCSDEMEFGINILKLPAEEIHQWLKDYHYGFFIIDGRAIRAHIGEFENEEATAEAIQEKIYELQDTGLFGMVYQNPGMAILEV